MNRKYSTEQKLGHSVSTAV